MVGGSSSSTRFRIAGPYRRIKEVKAITTIVAAFLLGLFCVAPDALAQTCQPGQRVAPQVGQFHLVFFAVSSGSVVDTIVDRGRLVGDYAIDLHKAAKAGQVERYSGEGTLNLYIKADVSKMPSELPYLGGAQICRGMARVEKRENGFFKIAIPISSGDNLAQASLVVPTGALVTVVCVKPTIPLAYAPEIIGGSLKGWQNTLCGLPGKVPGETLLSEMMQQGKKYALFPLVIKR
ncbi:MAG: hypothetical protein Q7S26_01125 [bacterium]|nr:hypothetical protein [bacterium]